MNKTAGTIGLEYLVTGYGVTAGSFDGSICLFKWHSEHLKKSDKGYHILKTGFCHTPYSPNKNDDILKLQLLDTKLSRQISRP